MNLFLSLEQFLILLSNRPQILELRLICCRMRGIFYAVNSLARFVWRCLISSCLRSERLFCCDGARVLSASLSRFMALVSFIFASHRGDFTVATSPWDFTFLRTILNLRLIEHALALLALTDFSWWVRASCGHFAGLGGRFSLSKWGHLDGLLAISGQYVLVRFLWKANDWQLRGTKY